jgi:hypothetical protein
MHPRAWFATPFAKRMQRRKHSVVSAVLAAARAARSPWRCVGWRGEQPAISGIHGMRDDAIAEIQHFVTDGSETVGTGSDGREPVRRKSLTE